MNSRLTVASSFVLLASACDEGATVGAEHSLRDSLCAFTPAPRWVLRDKDGQQVPALVEPRCGGSTHPAGCWPLDFASSDTFPCVRVIDHARRYVNLDYDLATGQFAPCQSPQYGDIDKTFKDIGMGMYLTMDCTGAPYSSTNSVTLNYFRPEFTRSRGVAPAAGQWWYISEQDCIISDDYFSDPIPYSAWYPDSMKCLSNVSQAPVCLLKPVPQWAIDLLPNPPYTLAVEYD